MEPGWQCFLLEGHLPDDFIDAVDTMAYVWVERISEKYDFLAFQLRSSTDAMLRAGGLRLNIPLQGKGIQWIDQCAHYLIYDATTMPTLQTLVQTLRQPVTLVTRSEHFVVLGLYPRESAQRPFLPRQVKTPGYLCAIPSRYQDTKKNPASLDKMVRWAVEFQELAPTNKHIEILLNHNDGTPVFLEGVEGRSVRLLGSRKSRNSQIPAPQQYSAQ